jgi:hypothetical protein
MKLAHTAAFVLLFSLAAHADEPVSNAVNVVEGVGRGAVGGFVLGSLGGGLISLGVAQFTHQFDPDPGFNHFDVGTPQLVAVYFGLGAIIGATIATPVGAITGGIVGGE